LKERYKLPDRDSSREHSNTGKFSKKRKYGNKDAPNGVRNIKKIEVEMCEGVNSDGEHPEFQLDTENGNMNTDRDLVDK